MDRIRSRRESRGWSQADLAERAGVSRQLIGAVESGRHQPNVGAAIGLARALDVTVEDLFAPEARIRTVGVDDEPMPAGTAVMTARVGDLLVGIPLGRGVAPTEAWAVADAIAGSDGFDPLPTGETGGLVVAGCDPVLGLLAGLLPRRSAERLVTVHASTGRSIAALAAGRVHGVVVHAPAGGLPRPPVSVRRWHVARWLVGLAGSGRSGPPSVEEVAGRGLRVVQRDHDAGSQRAFERALRSIGFEAAVPGPVAEGHVDVARRVAHGGGRAGVTMEAAARAFDLGFEPLEEHEVELWIDRRWSELPSARVLVELLDDPAVRSRVAALGGYDLSDSGDERSGGRVRSGTRDRSGAGGSR